MPDQTPPNSPQNQALAPQTPAASASLVEAACPNAPVQATLPRLEMSADETDNAQAAFTAI